MVRAKFRCSEIRHVSQQTYVKFEPVLDQDNNSWSKWTPAGELHMAITNPEAMRAFEIDKCYFLDFTLAPQKESDEVK